MSDVLHIIRTTGVCYDDRLCKEVGSIASFGVDSEVVCLQDDNGNVPAGFQAGRNGGVHR